VQGWGRAYSSCWTGHVALYCLRTLRIVNNFSIEAELQLAHAMQQWVTLVAAGVGQCVSQTLNCGPSL
jgi:hypothetical protein